MINLPSGGGESSERHNFGKKIAILLKLSFKMKETEIFHQYSVQKKKR